MVGLVQRAGLLQDRRSRLRRRARYPRITRRKKGAIIRGGHNVCPARIEDLAMCRPAVDRVAAAQVSDERSGEKVLSCRDTAYRRKA